MLKSERWTCKVLASQYGGGDVPKTFNMTACYTDQLTECLLMSKEEAEALKTTPRPFVTPRTFAPAVTTTTEPPLADWMLHDHENRVSESEIRASMLAYSAATPPPTASTSTTTTTSAPKKPAAEGQNEEVTKSLEAVNTGLSDVASRMDLLLAFADKLYRTCAPEGSRSANATEASVVEEVATEESSTDSGVQELTTPSPGFAEDPASHRNKRGEAREIVINTLGSRPGGAVHSRPKRVEPDMGQTLNLTLTRLVDGVKTVFFTATTSITSSFERLRKELMDGLPQVMSVAMKSSMEKVRQELMQVPPMYIKPLADMLENRFVAFETLANYSRRASDALSVVQAESRRTLRRIEEWANQTLANEAKTKRWAGGGAINCGEGKIIQDPCAVAEPTAETLVDDTVIHMLGLLAEEQIRIREELHRLSSSEACTRNE